jgi:hypothetical protein
MKMIADSTYELMGIWEQTTVAKPLAIIGRY